MSYTYDEGDFVGSAVEDRWLHIDVFEDESDSEIEKREKHQAELEAKWRERRRSFIQAVAHVKTSNGIRTKTIQKILNDSVDFLADKHIASEHLDSTFADLARRNKTLSIMIRGVLKESLGSKFDDTAIKARGGRFAYQRINERINSLCDELYQNTEREIAYIRVSKVQRLVHSIADEKLGEGSYLKLDKPLMRKLLSAARLHLNLHDIKTLDIDSLLYIAKKSALASEQEKQTPLPVYLSPNKRYVDNWRVKSLQSLFQVRVETEQTSFLAAQQIQLTQLWDVVFDEDTDQAKQQALEFYRQYIENIEAKWTI